MCGIIGIYNLPEAATLAYLGLYSQQHRGQESAGIVTCDNQKFHAHHAMGQVADIFNQKILGTLFGQNAIGHVRYSTAGGSHVRNCQPFTVSYTHGALAVAHNGNIVNALKLRSELEKNGAIFQSTMDTEVIMHLLAHSKKLSTVERLKEVLPKLTGAYSLVFLTETDVIAARDPDGFRPLVLGKKDGGYVFASETSAFDLLEAEFVREVAPGEIVIINESGVQSHFFDQTKKRRHHCIFEYVYFARPDSNVFGRDVYKIRKGFGRELAKEHPVKADLVVPVPDSGVPAAIGYAQESGIPFEMALVRNHYVGRTFIEPEQRIRHFGVKVKLNPIREMIEGRSVVLIDDSIVRGTTSQKIVRMVRQAGAKKVHMRISSPPTSWPCFYGIDTPSRHELISASKSVEEVREFIQADSLAFLSNEGLFHFEKQGPKEYFCDACFSGNYEIDADTIRNHIKAESGSLILGAT